MSRERLEEIRAMVRQHREHDHPVCRALRESDFEAVREFTLAMFEYELSDHEVAAICKKWGDRKNGWTISAGPAMWIKNRLSELGAFRLSRSLPPDVEKPCVTAIMHCFFLSLEETAEMLAFLQNEETEAQKKRIAKVAKSKLFGTPLVVQPIDSTAAKVARVK